MREAIRSDGHARQLKYAEFLNARGDIGGSVAIPHHVARVATGAFGAVGWDDRFGFLQEHADY
jgi:hypothetical protein